MICWDKIYGWYHLKWGVGISFAFARLSDHIMCSMFCAISLSPTPTRTPPHATLFFHFLPQNCQCCNYYCHLLHLVVLVSFKRRACSLGRVWPINGQNLPTESGLWGWTFVSFGVLVMMCYRSRWRSTSLGLNCPQCRRGWCRIGNI